MKVASFFKEKGMSAVPAGKASFKDTYVINKAARKKLVRA